ncbi:MAG: 3D domain-containing protein [Anaerolineae bacterium]
MWFLLVLTVTAYAPSAGGINCDADCSVTASGALPVAGVASCPRDWPFGARLYVPGYGEAECQDHGGAIYGRRIEVVIEPEEVAMEWGVKRLGVWVQKEPWPLSWYYDLSRRH